MLVLNSASSAAKAAESLPPLRILPLTGASNEQRLQLMSFLDQGEVDEVTQAAMQVLGHPQLRKFALYGKWRAVGCRAFRASGDGAGS